MRNPLLFTLLLLITQCYVYGQSVKIGDTAYGSISAAISAASTDDVIEISGTWTETSLTINKSITLRGSDPSTDIIQASNSKDDNTASTVITINSNASNVTIENLSIQNGYTTLRGGGIYSDKAGNVTLNNVIIKDNIALTDGGGVFLAGSGATITECVIQGNSSGGKGGGLAVVPNNAMTSNTEVKVYQSLIHDNTATGNGGAFYVSGNNGYGDQYIVNLTIENTTIFQNEALLGAIGFVYGCDIQANSVGNVVGENNVVLTMNHVTARENSTTNLSPQGKLGLFFMKDNEVVNGAAFHLYNSAILYGEDITYKVVNFAHTTNAQVYNNYLGGVNNLASVGVNQDNTTERKVSEANMSATLSNHGGNIDFLTINWGSPLINNGTSSYSTNNLGDVMGVSRGNTPDIGAYEFPEVELNNTYYSTITEAINIAASGDIINITGIHTESITIDKNIDIIGTDASKDIIQAHESENLASDRVIFISGVSDIHLSDLTVRHGKTEEKGGGLFLDEAIGSILLERLVIEKNYAEKNGGGIALSGSDIEILDTSIQNNTTEKNGGALFMTPKNSGGTDVSIFLNRCLLNANNALVQGGAFSIDGFNDYGDQYRLDMEMFNTVIYNNTSVIGGVATVKGVDLVADGGRVQAVGDNNVSLSMNHVTIAYNSISGTDKNKAGIYFINGAGTGNEVPFSMINSIFVNEDDTDYKVINFNNSSVGDFSNNFLGGVVNKPTGLDTNNQFDKTTTGIEIANELTDIGAEILVLELSDTSPVLDENGGDPGSNDTDIMKNTRGIAPDLGVYQMSAPDLPVELVYFTGKVEDEKIVLKWQTATEINNRHFEVQKSFSLSGGGFETVAIIEGEGNSHVSIDYDYTEDYTGGTVYYRLKQIDFDGAFTYSETILIRDEKYQSDLSVTVYPNPVQGSENIKIMAEGLSTSKIEVQLLNYTGTQVYNRTITHSGLTAFISIPTEGLKSGIYLLKLLDGKDFIVKKVILK